MLSGADVLNAEDAVAPWDTHTITWHYCSNTHCNSICRARHTHLWVASLFLILALWASCADANVCNSVKADKFQAALAQTVSILVAASLTCRCVGRAVAAGKGFCILLVGPNLACHTQASVRPSEPRLAKASLGGRACCWTTRVLRAFDNTHINSPGVTQAKRSGAREDAEARRPRWPGWQRLWLCACLLPGAGLREQLYNRYCSNKHTPVRTASEWSIFCFCKNK